MNYTLGLLMTGAACGLTIAAILAAIQQAWRDRQAAKKEWGNYKKALYALAEKIGRERRITNDNQFLSRR